MGDLELTAERRVNDPAGWIIDFIRKLGIDNLAHRYYGIYPATVADNVDPEKRGRCRLCVPAIGHEGDVDVPEDYWAMPNWPGLSKTAEGQMRGWFEPPSIGDKVWVQFQHGDPNFPVYSGGFLPKDGLGTELTGGEGSERKGYRTAAGHFLRFSDKPDDLHILLAKGDGTGATSGAMVSIDKDGTVTIMAENGSHVAISTVAGSITMINVDPDSAKMLSWMTLGKDMAQIANQSGCVMEMNKKNFTVNAPGDVTMIAGGKVWMNSGKVCLGKGPVFEPLVRGMKFMQWALMHTHTCAAPGAPTAPGLTPPPVIYNEMSEVVSIS